MASLDNVDDFHVIERSQITFSDQLGMVALAFVWGSTNAFIANAARETKKRETNGSYSIGNRKHQIVKCFRLSTTQLDVSMARSASS